MNKDVNKKFSFNPLWVWPILWIVGSFALSYIFSSIFFDILQVDGMIGYSLGLILTIVCLLFVLYYSASKGKFLGFTEKKYEKLPFVKIIIISAVVSAIYAIVKIFPFQLATNGFKILSFFKTFGILLLIVFLVDSIILTVSLSHAWSIAKKNQRSEEILQEVE